MNRDIKHYNNNVKDIFSILSHNKVNVVGSANIRKNIYYSDYDLFEGLNDKNINKIIKHFKDIFKQIKKHKSAIVSDFKCGRDHKGNAIRWTYKDIIKGHKHDITFREALLMDAIIKIDIIVFLNSRFLEITEVYNINYKMDDQHIIEEYERLIKEDKQFKALKKVFSVMKRHPTKNKDKMDKMTEFFNSKTGLLYRVMSDVKTIITVLQLGNDKFKLDDINDSLNMLKEQLSSFQITNNLNKAIKYKQYSKKINVLDHQVVLINNFLNKQTIEFINKYNI